MQRLHEIGATPIHCGVLADNKDVVQLLIDNGAFLNWADNSGYTPLHMARSTKIASLLISNGANLNAIDNDGLTPLASATKTGRTELASLFVSEGAVAHSKLVLQLVSNNESSFVEGLTEAVSLAESGNRKGLLALREAIRVRSGNKKIEFHTVGTVVTNGSSRYTSARDSENSTSAEQSQLLSNPKDTGNLISAFIQIADHRDLERLLNEVIEIGGPKSGFAFQLIYNELILSAISSLEPGIDHHPGVQEVCQYCMSPGSYDRKNEDGPICEECAHSVMLATILESLES